jgi:hypothetical protein
MATGYRGGIAGVYMLQVAKVNAEGYAVGQAADVESLSNNTAYPAYRVNHQVSVGEPNVTSEIAQFRGGQSNLGQVELGISELGTFDLVLAFDDMKFDALVSGSAINTTSVIGVTMGGPNRAQPELPQMCMVMEQGFYDGDTGANMKKTIVIPRCQIRRTSGGATQDGGVNPNTRTYTVTPTFTDTFVTGQTFNGAVQTGLDLDFSDGRTDQIDFVYSDGFLLHTFVGDNAETDVTLPYLPTSAGTAITVTANPNLICVNGTRTLVTSISVTTGVVVFASAPAAAAICVFFVPTAWATA